MFKHLLIVAGIVGLLVPPIAEAKLFKFPKKNPSFSIEFPDTWDANLNKDGSLEALAENEAVYMLIWEVTDPDELEADLEATLPNVVSDLEISDSETQEVNQHGVTFDIKPGSGTDPSNNEPINMLLGVFSTEEGRAFVMICTVEKDNFSARNKKQFDAVTESIQPLNGPAPKPE